MGRGKRLIIVDCTTENGPIPGALWTFSTESKTKREEKHDFQFIETAVAEEIDRENENSNQKQEDQMQKNKASTASKRQVNDNGSDQHSTEKTNVDNVLKNKAWFPLSPLRPRQRLISSQDKAISLKDDCSTL